MAQIILIGGGGGKKRRSKPRTKKPSATKQGYFSSVTVRPIAVRFTSTSSPEPAHSIWSEREGKRHMEAVVREKTSAEHWAKRLRAARTEAQVKAIRSKL
jgi:hypothetical protein